MKYSPPADLSATEQTDSGCCGCLWRLWSLLKHCWVLCCAFLFAAHAEGNPSEQITAPKWDAEVITIAIHTNLDDQGGLLRSLFGSSLLDIASIGEVTGIEFDFSGWASVETEAVIYVSIFDPEMLDSWETQMRQKFPNRRIVDNVVARLRFDTEACEYAILQNDLDEIVQGIIFASSNADYGYCIRRNLYHSMGFIDLLPAGEDSIRSLDSRTRYYTDFDLNQLRKAYLQ